LVLCSQSSGLNIVWEHKTCLIMIIGDQFNISSPPPPPPCPHITQETEVFSNLPLPVVIFLRDTVTYKMRSCSLQWDSKGIVP